MSDLRPVGEVLVSAQAEDLSADDLKARIAAVTQDYKVHRDPEQMGLQMSWLALLAESRIRQMEESHHAAGSPRDHCRHPGSGTAPVSSGLHGPTPESAAPTRPH